MSFYIEIGIFSRYHCITVHYIGNRYNLLKLLSVSKLQLEIQFVKQNTSMATNLEKGEKEGEVGGSRWNRLPFLAMYSLSQSRCSRSSIHVLGKFSWRRIMDLFVNIFGSADVYSNWESGPNLCDYKLVLFGRSVFGFLN